MNKSELLRKFYEDVWVKNNLEAIDLYFSPNAEAGGLIPEMSFGPDEFRELVWAVRNLLGDIEVELPVVLENDEWVAAIVKARATRADNGAPIDVTGQTIARFEGDKLVESYNQFDYISLFEQLDQLPPDTLPICMTGQKMVWA